MMHALDNIRAAKLPLSPLSLRRRRLGLAGCDDHAGDPKMQIGANPLLPAIQQYLMPPMRIAKAVGWEAIKLPRQRRDCRSMHWRPALPPPVPLRPPPMETCWWSRATVRKRRSTGPGHHYRLGTVILPAPRQKTQTALHLLRDIDGKRRCQTANRVSGRTSTRHSA